MKSLIDNVVVNTARVLSFIVTYDVLRLFKLFTDCMHWYAMKPQFASIGKASFIESPATLINPKNITIGEKFLALSRLRLEAYEEYEGVRFTPSIIIGDNVRFGTDCHIGCIDRVEIADNVLIASKVFIADHAHGEISPEALTDIPLHRKLSSKGPVVVEENVWIGEGVVVLAGVRIGKNAIVGANSVVTRDVPPNAVFAGIPAKVIKTLA